MRLPADVNQDVINSCEVQILARQEIHPFVPDVFEKSLKGRSVVAGIPFALGKECFDMVLVDIRHGQTAHMLKVNAHVLVEVLAFPHHLLGVFRERRIFHKHNFPCDRVHAVSPIFTME